MWSTVLNCEERFSICCFNYYLHSRHRREVSLFTLYDEFEKLQNWIEPEMIFFSEPKFFQRDDRRQPTLRGWRRRRRTSSASTTNRKGRINIDDSAARRIVVHTEHNEKTDTVFIVIVVSRTVSTASIFVCPGCQTGQKSCSFSTDSKENSIAQKSSGKILVWLGWLAQKYTKSDVL